MLFPRYDIPAPHTLVPLTPPIHLRLNHVRLLLRHTLYVRFRLHLRTVRRPGLPGVLLIPTPCPLPLQHLFRVFVFFYHHVCVFESQAHHR